ncbi:MAG TPA: PQQ-binding-like beta-propeller repeat protein [Patescibacteria group bacterium]|jgi:outer membrane protein assembly factor BamB|nr:PQQ-binding-like beta-propeller repeat protein [Patescibacteria group bacterium]
MTAEPRNAAVDYPGGIRVRSRWAGSGEGAAVFALTESGGPLTDHGPLAGPAFERMCRAELRVESPAGPWTVRLASPVFDDPAALLWDSESLLVAKYGFITYGLEARSGELRWSHRSGSPVEVVLGSSRLPHVLVQAEVETFAIAPDGEVAWRVAHSDVVTAAELVGGRLILTSYSGQLTALDPRTGLTSSA